MISSQTHLQNIHVIEIGDRLSLDPSEDSRAIELASDVMLTL